MRPVDLLSSVIPDELTLKRLLIRFPYLAAAIIPILTSAACNFVPPAQAQTGAQPKEPTTLVTNTNTPIPTPEDYGVDVGPVVKEAAKVLLTVEAEATSEPTPTNTNTPEPPPTANVSESMTEIVFGTNVFKRLGPGTNYDTAGSYESGDELDFSEIVEKLESGGYTWLRRSDNTWFALVPGVSHDAESVRHLPDATSIPVAPTRTPTRLAPTATPQPAAPPTEIVPTQAPVEVSPPTTNYYFSNWPGFGPDYNFANGGGYDLYPPNSDFIGTTDGGTVLKGPPTIENDNMVFTDYEFRNYTIVQISEVVQQPNGTLQLTLNKPPGLYTVDQNTSYIAVFNNFLPGNALGYKPADFKGVMLKIFTPGKILGLETQGDGVKTVFVKIN